MEKQGQDSGACPDCGDLPRRSNIMFLVKPLSLELLLLLAERSISDLDWVVVDLSRSLAGAPLRG